MSSSAERDYTAGWPGEESGSSGNWDVSAGVSRSETNAFQDPHRLTTADLPGKISTEARQREDHISSGSVAWKAGHALIEQREYGRAGECFRRMLLSADRLTVEAAEVAVQLCIALGYEQSVEKKLRDTHKVLDRDLSQLSHEEVSLVRDMLAPCVEGRFSAAHHALSVSAVSEATIAMAEGSSSLVDVPVRVIARPRLRVHFFGRFELLRDDEVMCLGRNARALAILKYLLAYRRERPVPQDYLMGWLWPESDPKRARWSLNSAVYALRKLLGWCLPSLPTSETVLFEEGGYRLSTRVLLNADTEEFDSFYEEGRCLEEADRMPEAIGEYEKAAELYRGDFLIEDLYEDWTMIERERLVEAYTDLLGRLAGCYLKAGRLRESIRTCYRVLEKDRCEEDTHRLLMECYVRLGQRARALRQYRLCEVALRHEYDMEPSPETRTFYASILKDGGLLKARSLRERSDQPATHQ